MSRPEKRTIRLSVAVAAAALAAPLIGYLFSLTTAEIQVVGLIFIGTAFYLAY